MLEIAHSNCTEGKKKYIGCITLVLVINQTTVNPQKDNLYIMYNFVPEL